MRRRYVTHTTQIRLFALIMEVAFPTGAGLSMASGICPTRLFAGFVPCKRSVGL